MRENPLVFLSFGVLFFAILEAQFAKAGGNSVYSKSQTEVSIGLALGNLLVALTVYAFLQKLIHIPADRKPFVLPHHFGWGILAFMVLDFLSYLNHRLSHKIQLFWADHAVHHANTEFNILMHLTQGWTGFISPLLAISAFIALFGNAESIVYTYFVTAFVVQTLAHTQLIHKLGLLEYFLVTPSHHRVHHAVERVNHDRNYGMVLIIWDKLFGTFKPEGDLQIRTFGLANSPALDEPLWRHAFFGWQDFIKTCRSPSASKVNKL